MRQRPPDILPPQLAVEADGGVDLLHHHRWPGGEAPAPLWVGGLVPLVRRLAQVGGPSWYLITRRHLLAAAGTLAAGLVARKPRAQELQDLATALKPTDPPVTAPAISFVAADGRSIAWRTFSATAWSSTFGRPGASPCVAEMPSLAALSKTLAPDDIAVLPLSSDRGGATWWRRSISSTASPACRCCWIRKGAAAHAWHARGIPTSLIIDKQGRERARLEGSADWSTRGGGGDRAPSWWRLTHYRHGRTGEVGAMLKSCMRWLSLWGGIPVGRHTGGTGAGAAGTPSGFRYRRADRDHGSRVNPAGLCQVGARDSARNLAHAILHAASRTFCSKGKERRPAAWLCSNSRAWMRCGVGMIHPRTRQRRRCARTVPGSGWWQSRVSRRNNRLRQPLPVPRLCPQPRSSSLSSMFSVRICGSTAGWPCGG